MPSSSYNFMTNMRKRLGRPGFKHQDDCRPKAVLTAGAGTRQVSVAQAVGFDVLVCGIGDWFVGQKITLGFRSQLMSIELVIPGRIHWHEQKQSEVELGIVLNEAVPAEFVVQEAGCLRNSIRFPSNIFGTLNWLEPHSVSCPATVINYSREGICLQSKIAPEIGTEVQFSWLSNETAKSITGISRWVIGKSEGSLTGCELTNAQGYTIAGIAPNSTRATVRFDD